MEDRFSGPYDAALHLLDRQVVDCDGLLVCKVDDLELEERPGGLYATGILVGRTALIPRLTGALGQRSLHFWRRMGDEQGDRTDPYRIAFEDVTEVTTIVRLRRPRHALLERTRPARRMRELLELDVRNGRGENRGSVLDVRLDGDHRVTGFIIGSGRPGSLLGYDRDSERGPWLVAVVVRWLHRHAGFVPIDEAEVAWETGQLIIDGDLEPLRPA
ncbi:PRC-barrel domain-containing protein [Nocardioides sp. Kera G14]|nr:PRC-barrel domain-containing protein [Nocardioides sp. Kera G14]UDY25367.1 PRC-barrel domain-containing protein [Nocardioides sp. Kera G14]